MYLQLDDNREQKLTLIIASLRWFQKTAAYAMMDPHIRGVATGEGDYEALLDDGEIDRLVEDLFTSCPRSEPAPEEHREAA